MPEIAGIGLGAAFLAGLVSFLSPCILPLVPGYISFAAGQSLDRQGPKSTTVFKLNPMTGSLLFVTGFSTVFIALGASASAIGSLFQSYRYEAGYVAGGVIVLFGLHMTGLLRFPWFNRDWRLPHPATTSRPVAAFGLGAAFAFGWTPCIGPILATILGLGASQLSVADGSLLLAVYSAGLAVPFLLTALFLNRIARHLGRLGRVTRRLHQFLGGVMIFFGLAMATGYLNTFGTWMLREFPIFEKVVW